MSPFSECRSRGRDLGAPATAGLGTASSPLASSVPAPAPAPAPWRQANALYLHALLLCSHTVSVRQAPAGLPLRARLQRCVALCSTRFGRYARLCSPAL